MVCVLAIHGSAGSTAQGGVVRVHLEKRALALAFTEMRGVEYLSLADVARASGASLQRLAGGRSYRLRFPRSSIIVTEGDPEVRVGGRSELLPDPPRRIGRAMAAPLDLLPLALRQRYGGGRVTWDPAAREAWIVSGRHSLRLLRYRAYPEFTRIVVVGTRRHDFAMRHDESGRVILDVKRGTLSPSMRPIQIADGLVSAIDLRQVGRDARILMQGTDQLGSSKAFALRRPDRIVIDLFPRAALASSQPRPQSKGVPGAGGAVTSAPPTVAADAEPATPFRSETVRAVVIDPGHGGRDPGAIGPSGVREKDVVLDIGLRLKRMIEEQLGLRVIMTRASDVFVPLEERAAIANRHNADFFISLHVNAAPQSRAIGSETYFLSREPSDRGARASAIRENTVLSLEGIGPREQESLKTILWDMAQTFYVKESSELAEALLNELRQILKVNDRGVKSAPFVVLIGAAMPSVLVEAAFITNPEEERRLRREAYRQQVAEALLAGVARFKDRYEKRLGIGLARSRS